MRFFVDNMTCKHCKMRIEQTLKDAGFSKASIDPASRTVTLKLGNKTVEDVKNAIEGIGYHFELMEA